MVQTDGEDGAEDGADPVDPVVVGEGLADNAGSERSSGVDSSTGGEDGDKMANEERHSNGEGGHEGGSVLLNGEKEDSQTQLSGAEHLNPETSGSGHAVTKGVNERDGAGGKSVGDTSGGHTGEQLGDSEAQSSHGRDSADQGKSQSDARVELTSGDSEEDEDVDEQRESETKGDHDDLGGVGAGGGLVVVGDSGNQVGEQQEHEGTDKLTDAGNGEVSHVLSQTERSGSSVGLLRGHIGGGRDGIHGLSGLRGGNGGEVVHRLLGHCRCDVVVNEEREGCKVGGAGLYILKKGVTRTRVIKHTNTK